MSFQPTPETALTPEVLADLIAQRRHFEACLSVGEVHDLLQAPRQGSSWGAYCLKEAKMCAYRWHAITFGRLTLATR